MSAESGVEEAATSWTCLQHVLYGQNLDVELVEGLEALQ
jgi:hypothetical protein